MRARDENKETAIREKAMEMIVNDGFDGLSMQKLAKAANVSPATIYIYYKNREDLLNQLFDSVQQTFSDVALEGFTADLPFEEGIWLQWKNRFRFITQYPIHFSFYEQFRNSPQMNRSNIKLAEFKENMRSFLQKAIKNGTIKKMDPEIFWSIAYGAFYSLIKFHLNEKSIMDKRYELTEEKMRFTFDMVMKSFKK